METYNTQEKVYEYMRRGLSYDHAWKALELSELDQWINDSREMHNLVEASKKLGCCKFAGRGSTAEMGCNK